MDVNDLLDLDDDEDEDEILPYIPGIDDIDNSIDELNELNKETCGGMIVDTAAVRETVSKLHHLSFIRKTTFGLGCFE
jgi:hypothetical protein